MNIKKKDLKKTLKVTVNTHTRLVKLAKSKVEIFDDIIERIATIAEAFPKIEDKINNLYNFQLNIFKGNDERREQIEKERREFLEWLRSLNKATYSLEGDIK